MFDNFGNFYCRKNIENKNKYVMSLYNSCGTCPDQTFFLLQLINQYETVFLCLVHITIRCNINNLSSIQRISKYISITTIQAIEGLFYLKVAKLTSCPIFQDTHSYRSGISYLQYSNTQDFHLISLNGGLSVLLRIMLRIILYEFLMSA